MSFLRGGSSLLQYRILRVLGAGGFGVTYLARDEKLDKNFAIKEYFPSDFAYRKGATVRAKGQREDDFSWGKERFIEEARVLARFAHPNIVNVVQIFDAHNTAYMVEEYLGERSLQAWLDEIGGPPTQEELDLLVEPLLNALDVIHRNGVLHRDIAPDNICIRDDGSPALFDFGSAREAVAQRTKTVSSVVKSGYSPAEQYSTRGKGQGPWSDIYALAATLYHAVTGSKPEEVMERVLTDEYVSARKAAKGAYRESFLAAIDCGLRLAPSQRPQSVAEWRPALLGKADQKETPEPRHEPQPEAGDAASAEANGATNSEAEIATAVADWNAARSTTRGGLGYLLALALFVGIFAIPLALMQYQERVRQIATTALPNEDVSKKSQQDVDSGRKQSVDEEQIYRDARGDLNRLRDYLANCSYCSHRSDVLSEIARLDDAEQISGLSAYSLCQSALDSSKSDWDQGANYQKHAAEAQRRGFDIDGCRRALGMQSRAEEEMTGMSGSSVCQNALDSSKSDWDQSTNYQKYVVEAQRRGFDIDKCRGALGMQSLAEEQNPTVKFDITNNTSSTIGVAFYDGNNKNRVSPDEGRYYPLRAKSNQTYSVSCSAGQKVCFGAWSGSGGLDPFWGVGSSGKEDCAHCCPTCPTRGAVSYSLNDSDARRPKPTLTWTITDNTRQNIAVAFYSATRSGHGWPDWNQNWSLHGGENTFTLSCQAEEKICFGAWNNNNINGSYWGVGPWNQHGCQGCCAICNGGNASANVIETYE